MDSINTYISNITLKAMETEEEFLFQSVAPFCERITQREISKQELVNALLHYRDLENENESLKYKLHDLVRENESLKDKLYSIELALEDLQDRIKYE